MAATFREGVSNEGTVYKIDPTGRETVLYSFSGGIDGASPYSGVILDAAGNLYGTTVYGGALENGTVYKVNPAGFETVLYSFQGGTDGYYPEAGVISDGLGNLFGTTSSGGTKAGGTVFELVPNP